MTFRTMALGLVCAMALATPVHAQGVWPDNCKLSLAATLPFSIAGGHIAVQVQVNGTPREFIIDTGGFTSSIDASVASELHLPLFGIRSNIRITDASGKEATHYTTVETLSLGNLQASKIQLMVMSGGTDGLIAPDLLRNFDVEIDIPNRTINLFRPHPCSGKAVYWTDKFASVAIDVTEAGNIRVPVELNGRSLYALLDTGAPISLLAADIAESRFGIKPQGPEGNLRGALGGELTVTSTPFETLKIGDTVFDKPLIGLSRSKADSFNDGTSLILGMREMSKFHIYIAYRERKLYISDEASIAATPEIAASAKVMEPDEAIAAALRAAPTPFAGTFTFIVRSTGQGNGNILLNSQADFHDPKNLTVALPRAEAEKIGGAPSLVGKRITVVGSARRIQIQPMQDGKPSGEPYAEVRIIIPSADQVTVGKGGP